MVSAQPAELCGRKVLLCEDNALNREIAVAILGSEGMSVDTAENGSVGVSRFSHSAPGEYSAVLMDIRMPVMDGCEAARQIRGLSRPDALSVPIIAMTADAFADDVQKCLDCGMNSHVAKPIDTAQLISVLRSLLG
jgi:CheY-like chemotaxis protein